MQKIVITTTRTFKSCTELQEYMKLHLSHIGSELLESGHAMMIVGNGEDVTITYELVETIP